MQETQWFGPKNVGVPTNIPVRSETDYFSGYPIAVPRLVFAKSADVAVPNETVVTPVHNKSEKKTRMYENTMQGIRRMECNATGTPKYCRVRDCSVLWFNFPALCCKGIRSICNICGFPSRSSSQKSWTLSGRNSIVGLLFLADTNPTKV